MKKLLLISTSFLCFTLFADAKIWRVNNDASKGANFISLQLANDNASVLNGDTVHLEPSTNGYGSPTITKALIIIGNGYFLSGIGANTGLQQNTATCNIDGTITFQSALAGAGAPNTGAGSGTGAQLIGINIFQLALQNVSNVTITRCKIQSITFSNYGNIAANNLKITKNFIKGQIFSSGFTGTPSVDVSFENNLFSKEVGQGGNNIQIGLPTTMKGLFRNNIINDFITPTMDFSNFYVTNNIFLQTTGTAVNNTNVNNVYKNNIFLIANPGNGIVGGTAGNVVSANVANIFTADQTTAAGDARFQIIANATNPAFQGGETIGAVITPSCGAFGATDPYRKSGIPAVPAIYSLTIPGGVATGATSMQISVSTRSNN
jgi:hypothetical protein